MNNQFPERLSELNRQKIQNELQAIRLEEEALKGKSLINRSLVGLGNWMVETGQKLRARHAAALQVRGLEFTDKNMNVKA
jgi:hypothetical protein